MPPSLHSAMASTLAKCRPYLQRAEELAGHEPAVAYYCRLHAIELLMRAHQKGETSPEEKQLLLAELQKAEDTKKALNISSTDGQATAESFALRVFDAADAADRSANDKSTQAAAVSKLYAAALFLDVCAQFHEGELPPDLAEKARYARFRVVQIREGLKQGIPSYPAAAEAGAETQASPPLPISGYSASSAAPAAVVAPPAVQMPVSQPPQPARPASSAVPKPSITGAGRDEARKQLELAVSALDFRDVPTARKCLEEALRLLG